MRGRSFVYFFAKLGSATKTICMQECETISISSSNCGLMLRDPGLPT